MPHKYDKIIEHFSEAFSEMRRIGLADAVAKGGVGEILLAGCLNHELRASDKGADGVSPEGKRYEYKVSITNQFNFHFGTREENDPPKQKVERHFKDIDGAYCAFRNGTKFKTIAYCPTETLRPVLIAHFEKESGNQLNKVFSFEAFLKLPGATVIPIPKEFQA